MDGKPSCPVASDIPMPKKHQRKRECYYPWGTIQVGESFPYNGSIGTGRRALWAMGHRYGVKFRIAEYEGKLRVWRVA